MDNTLARLDDDELFHVLALVIFVRRIAHTERIRERRSRIVAELTRCGWTRLDPMGRRWAK